MGDCQDAGSGSVPGILVTVFGLLGSFERSSLPDHYPRSGNLPGSDERHPESATRQASSKSMNQYTGRGKRSVKDSPTAPLPERTSFSTCRLLPPMGGLSKYTISLTRRSVASIR